MCVGRTKGDLSVERIGPCKKDLLDFEGFPLVIGLNLSIFVEEDKIVHTFRVDVVFVQGFWQR